MWVILGEVIVRILDVHPLLVSLVSEAASGVGVSLSYFFKKSLESWWDHHLYTNSHSVFHQGKNGVMWVSFLLCNMGFISPALLASAVCGFSPFKVEVTEAERAAGPQVEPRWH